MDNGIYIALSQQLALFRDMSVTTNNLANANTTGYQAEQLLFENYLNKDNNMGDRNKMSFANDISTYRNVQDGARRITGNSLDVALEGEGQYFMIETPLGRRYTRAGAFTLDGAGTLITAAGYPVLDNSGQKIEFPEEVGDISIGGAGNVAVNGEDFATIGVAIFENPQLLKQSASGIFNSEVDPAIGTEDNVKMAQGVLEDANVQPVIEMTHMIEVTRAVANTAKYIETIYDLQRKTTNAWTQQS